MVDLAVTGGSTESAGKVEVDTRDVGAGQVVDRHVVRAAECVEGHELDSTRVHRDVRRLAEEPQPVPVRRQVDRLGGCGAVEHHGVRAVVALDRVAAVARVPDERVVAWAEVRDVVAAVAVDRVVAGTAVQRLGTGTAGDRVVARTSVDPRRDGVGEGSVRVVDAHLVVAAARLDDDALDRGPREAEVGGPVVAEVHLDDGGVAGREPKRDPVACFGPPHAQCVMCEPRGYRLELALLPSRGSLSGVGRGRRDGDDGCRRHRQGREAPNP